MGPTLHLLASAVIYYDTKTGGNDESCVSGSGGSECTAWRLSLFWNGFAAYFIMTWFHELPVGGMNEPDNLIGDWNGMNLFTWLVSIGVSGYALYADRKAVVAHPLAQTASIVTIAIGLWYNKIVNDYQDR